jgi:hypothetical protein
LRKIGGGTERRRQKIDRKREREREREREQNRQPQQTRRTDRQTDRQRGGGGCITDLGSFLSIYSTRESDVAYPSATSVELPRMSYAPRSKVKSSQVRSESE